MKIYDCLIKCSTLASVITPVTALLSEKRNFLLQWPRVWGFIGGRRWAAMGGCLTSVSHRRSWLTWGPTAAAWLPQVILWPIKWGAKQSKKHEVQPVSNLGRASWVMSTGSKSQGVRVLHTFRFLMRHVKEKNWIILFLVLLLWWAFHLLFKPESPRSSKICNFWAVCSLTFRIKPPVKLCTLIAFTQYFVVYKSPRLDKVRCRLQHTYDLI